MCQRRDGEGWSQKIAKELGPRELSPRLMVRHDCTCKTRSIQRTLHLPVNKVKMEKVKYLKVSAEMLGHLALNI